MVKKVFKFIWLIITIILGVLVFIFIPKNPKKKEQEIYDEVKEIEKSINELHKDKENIKKEIENTEEKIKDLEKKKQIKLAQETEIDDAIEYLKNISRE